MLIGSRAFRIEFPLVSYEKICYTDMEDKNMLLDVNGIKEIIPHRYPFLLVDCIEEMEPGVKAVGYKNVTVNEPFSRDIFRSSRLCRGF